LRSEDRLEVVVSQKKFNQFQQELRENCRRFDVPFEALSAEMRYVMATFGDAAGVNLRGVSQEAVDLFAYHLFDAASAEARARRIAPGAFYEHRTSEHATAVNEVMNAAAARTVNELFVAKGEA
jgi:hypothetical protein